MKIYNQNEMIGGWFVGDFFPSAYRTSDFEVGYKIHPNGEKWDVHYHEFITEINLIVKGKMIIQNKILKAGEIFVIEPYEIADPVFVEDCEIIVVKVPSVKGDKACVSKLDPTSQ